VNAPKSGDFFEAGKYDVDSKIIWEWNLITMMQENEGCVYDNHQMGTVWNAAINFPFPFSSLSTIRFQETEWNVLHKAINISVCRNTSVGIATCCGLEWSEIECRWKGIFP
jgi:hypothetical protein